MKKLILHLFVFTIILSCSNITPSENKTETEIEWYSPVDNTPREQCPCCDYISLPERGNYLICPICFWEDDGQDIDELDIQSGPNHGITLRKGRANFKEFGACEKEMIQYVISKENRKSYKIKDRISLDPNSKKIKN